MQRYSMLQKIETGGLMDGRGEYKGRPGIVVCLNRSEGLGYKAMFAPRLRNKLKAAWISNGRKRMPPKSRKRKQPLLRKKNLPLP